MELFYLIFGYILFIFFVVISYYLSIEFVARYKLNVINRMIEIRKKRKF